MANIVTFGEILLRFSTQQGKRLSEADQVQMHYGGAEANVAVSLANFGHNVNVISKVPDNPIGTAVENHLRSHRVKLDYLLKGGERLGTYYLETGVGQRSPQVVYDRKYSSLSEIGLDEVDFDDIFRGKSLFHVSGITPALSENLRKMTLTALKKAKEHGVTTSFDFNYRSKLWSQREAAEAFKPMLPYVDICFCGELDALYLLEIEKAKDSLEKGDQLTYYYEKIKAMYPNIDYFSSTFRTVISASTNELQGNLYVNGSLYQSGIQHIDHIVDRVGGGDAYAAGILHGILNRWEPKRIVEFATAASALKHTVHGDCNLFTEREVLSFVESGSGKIVR